MFKPGQELIGGVRFPPCVHRVLIEDHHAARHDARPGRLQQALGGGVNIEIAMQKADAESGPLGEIARQGFRDVAFDQLHPRRQIQPLDGLADLRVGGLLEKLAMTLRALHLVFAQARKPGLKGIEADHLGLAVGLIDFQKMGHLNGADALEGAGVDNVARYVGHPAHQVGARH